MTDTRNLFLRFLRFRPLSHSYAADVIILLLLGLILFASGLGLRDPWPPDEPRFALVAKQMVESGDWFFPRRGGELYPDKPPVFMWTQAILYAITGSMRVSFLLPSILSSLLSLFLVYDLGRRMWNRRTGIVAGLALLTTLQFVLQARSAQIDAMLCMWTTLAVYGFMRHLVCGKSWGWYYIAFAAAGFGVITKGVGIIAVFILLPYLYARRKEWRQLSTIEGSLLHWLAGPVVMLIAIGLWFFPMIIQANLSTDPAIHAYRDNILLKQTAERYVHMRGHNKPFWYFLVNVIPFFWLPMSIALPWAVAAWKRRFQRRDARYLLLLGWIVLVLLFFTLSPNKRGVYILPAVPALALAFAPLISGLLKKIAIQRTAYTITALIATGLLGIYITAIVIKPELANDVWIKHQLKPWPLIGVTGIIAVLWLAWSRPRRGVAAFVGFMASFWLLFGWWGYPMLNDGRTSGSLMQNVGRIIGPTAELALVNWKEQIMLHADRPVVNFGFLIDTREQEKDAVHWLHEGENRWVLTQVVNLKPCFKPDGSVFVGRRHRRDWYLVNKQAATDACQK